MKKKKIKKKNILHWDTLYNIKIKKHKTRGMIAIFQMKLKDIF